LPWTSIPPDDGGGRRLGGKIVAQNVVVLPDDPRKAIQPIVAAIRKLIAAHSDKSLTELVSVYRAAPTFAEELIFAPNLKWPASSIKSRIHGYGTSRGDG